MTRRRKHLNWLIGLSAGSAALLYVMQGALATGADVHAFPAWFWLIDYALWGFRALIEAAVIAYLFTTRTEDATQKRFIGWLEFLLIALITLTVGPALRAVGLGQPVRDTMHPLAYTLWSYGIAAYTSLMIGSAGYAYRAQPHDDVRTSDVDVQQYLDEVNELRATEAQLFNEMTRLQSSVQAWQLLGPGEQARLIALCSNGDRPAVQDVADALECHRSTVQRGYDKVTK